MSNFSMAISDFIWQHQKYAWPEMWLFVILMFSFRSKKKWNYYNYLFIVFSIDSTKSLKWKAGSKTHYLPLNVCVALLSYVALNSLKPHTKFKLLINRNGNVLQIPNTKKKPMHVYLISKRRLSMQEAIVKGLEWTKTVFKTP